MTGTASFVLSAAMSNVLDTTKQQQVLALGRLGWSLRRIESETGVRRETASAYLQAAGIPVRTAGWHGKFVPLRTLIADAPVTARAEQAVEADSKPAIQTITDSAVLPGLPEPWGNHQASQCEPHRDFIIESLGKGRNAMAIWQDLVDDHGFAARYASVQRFVAKVRGEVSAEEGHPFIITPPGQEAQVDYGQGPMVRHPVTGKYRRTRLFVLTLGHSRKSVRLLVWKSGTREWAELHEQAFRRLGGAVRVVVLDNLREGVLKPDIYDPALNPVYRDVLKHYGAVALTCRVADPDRKGKVESAVGHAQRTPLKGLYFESLEEAQAYLDRWEERWGDTRIHGTVKRQVAAMFAEEKPTLLPLPTEPFRYYKFGKRTVGPNGCVEVDGAYYGPPPGHLGRELDVQWDGLHVRILDPKTGELLREHYKVRPGKVRVQDQDKPKRAAPATIKLLNRAACAGKNIGLVCQRIYAADNVVGVNRILGVLSLAKKYGSHRVEQACILALEVGLPNYRFLKHYFDKQPEAPVSLRQIDPLIRQLTLYRDLIDRKTQGVSDEHD